MENSEIVNGALEDASSAVSDNVVSLADVAPVHAIQPEAEPDGELDSANNGEATVTTGVNNDLDRLPVLYDTVQLTAYNVEGAVRSKIGGWLVCPDSTDSLIVRAYSGTRCVGEAVANLTRKDLSEAGFDEGAFGFEIDLDTSMFNGLDHDLIVCVEGVNEPIGACSVKGMPFASSQVVSIDGGRLSATVVLNAKSDSSAFKCEILVDNKLVAEATCSATEKPLHYELQEEIPTQLLDSELHVYSVRLKNFLTDADVFMGRLTSLTTPWEHINNSEYTKTLSSLSNVSAYRYQSLQSHIEFSEADVLKDVQLAHKVIVEGYENRKQFPKLRLPLVSEPKVSVVIPVHNQFSLTYNCVASLILAFNHCQFEVVLVDDASTDNTVDYEDYFENIRCVTNPSNRGFLLSAKAGVEASSGEYAILLNNDTEVTTGWLDEMVGVFNRFDNVGAVGSKLIYPNGKLQEAGGIVWNNGKPWNIGNGKNSSHPSYNYVRQADYLSGAALMIQRDVWDEIGGFSEEFIPAYYEDTDVCFKVRDAGYRTMYCPHSIVVHFEGMSNGRDTNAGIKRFQSVNAPTFRRKWRRAYRHNGQEGVSLQTEMDRNVDFRALVVDYTTPRPNNDAGGYAAVQEIALLQELGCKVTFAPNNMAHMGLHTENLQKMGVECVHAPFYHCVGDFLQERGKEFDVVYITRYDIAEEVIDSVRAFSRAKILFNNADLHFLREMRAASTAGTNDFSSALTTRDRELSVMRSVDAVLSYNEIEHTVIASHNFTQDSVFKCPWVLEDRRSNVPFEDRHGIAFLGGFNHVPNCEAVKYFVDMVMPILRAQNPDIKFHIYGSGVTPEIESLAAEDVIIEGYVDELSDLFDSCRVFVAPLLSGAGIKGKVLESIAHGVPCVLSPVAAEATGLVHEHNTFIADTPAEWVESIVELYESEERWKAFAEKSNVLVHSKYGKQSGLELMSEVFQYVELDPEENRLPLFAETGKA